MHDHKGSCHCGAIEIRLQSPRHPEDQILGACQCAFCRKHNIRAFSAPDSDVTLTAIEPDYVQHYAFGLQTSHAVLCKRCGVYMAMILQDSGTIWSTINIDTLDDRAQFTNTPQPRVYDDEDKDSRITRRKSQWCPTVWGG